MVFLTLGANIFRSYLFRREIVNVVFLNATIKDILYCFNLKQLEYKKVYKRQIRFIKYLNQNNHSKSINLRSKI